MLNKSIFRSQLFRHLDGLVTAPVAYALFEKGVLNTIKQEKKISLSEILAIHPANKGYLNVGLRVLASQGFIDYTIENEFITISTNKNSQTVFELIPLYKDVVELSKLTGQFHSQTLHEKSFLLQKQLFEKYKVNYNLTFSDNENERRIQEQILSHIEGNLVASTLVQLAMSGMFHKYFMETRFRPEEFHKHPEHFAEILNFFAHLGWFTEKDGFYQFTESGLFFAKKASAYGVTVSYLPMFRKIDEIIFGNPDILRNTNPDEDEKHVDREMNVWGSGGAHTSYFKIVDNIIIEIFNRPIEEQPKGILDMGCGNGAFLQHLFEVIDRQTLRGKMLDDYPLFLVGADYNQAALKVTRANLINADIWAKVIWGDIGRPDLLSDNLRENYNIDLKDLLNVRTFLDHNRIWETPKNKTQGRISTSTGAFAHRGQHIQNVDVEDNLLEHLQKWSPYVEKYGLLIIELHTINPALTAKNIGKTAATAYDATHGFSDQYIVEIEVLHKIAAEAGLYPDTRFFHKFPDSDLATVSINLLKGN